MVLPELIAPGACCVLIANYAGLSLWDLIRLDRDK